MALVFCAMHKSPRPELLNEEWLILENTGPTALNANGWTIAVARKGGQRGNASTRPTVLGALSPGFLLAPGEKIRLVTGTASKKAQGTPPPGDGIKSYHLFLREPLLGGPGAVIHVQWKQIELARAAFDPTTESGVAA